MDSAGIPVQWTENHTSQLHKYIGLSWYPAQWTENKLGLLDLRTWDVPEFNQPTQLNIDGQLTEMMIYSGPSYFLRECTILESKGTNQNLWLEVEFLTLEAGKKN